MSKYEYNDDVFVSIGRVVWLIIIALVALFVAITWTFAAEYGSYRKSKCQWCGRDNVRLAVHHIQPQHLHPELRDNPTNLVTLCDPILGRSGGCHFVIGHKRNWTNEVTELQVLFPKGSEQ